MSAGVTKRQVLMWSHEAHVLRDLIIVMWCGAAAHEEAASLERLQNFAARTILHQRRRYSASSARRELQLKLSFSTLSSRHDVHLAQHSFKAILGLLPPYLWSLFTLTSATHGHCTRQASTVSVHYPLPRTNFGKRPSATVVLPPGTLCQTTLALHPPFLLLNP